MKKGAGFTENVKMSLEADMLCPIHGEMIGNLGASCHITNDDRDLYDIIGINESVHSSLGNMSAIKRGKLWMPLVNGSKRLHILWLIKFVPKQVTLYSLTYKLMWEQN